MTAWLVLDAGKVKVVKTGNAETPLTGLRSRFIDAGELRELTGIERSGAVLSSAERADAALFALPT